MPTDDAALDRMNRDVDAAFGSDGTIFDDWDPALALTIHRLRALDDAFALSPAVKDHMWRTAMSYQSAAQPGQQSTSRALTSVLNGPAPVSGSWQSARRPARVRRRWPGAELATAAVLVLALVTGYAAYRLALPSSQAGVPSWQTPQPSALYIADLAEDDAEAGTRQFAPLDPTTLADLDDESTISLDWSSTLSADGSTMVSIVYDSEPMDDEAIATSEADPNAGSDLTSEDVSIIIRDGQSGQARTNFRPVAPVTYPQLSRDGSRLVVMVHPDLDPARHESDPPASRLPARWYVFDTDDGDLLATVQAEKVEHGKFHFWIDPAGQRLYYLPIVGSSRETVPALLRLYAYDLTTGDELGRLDLPGILAGNWRSGNTSGDDFTLSRFEPGATLSPDGRRLAIVHTDGAVLTLIDTEQLAIEQTIQLGHQTGWRETLVGLLPLVPQQAAAKSEEGTTLTATFGADGRRLYVFGVRAALDENGDQEWRDLGLRVIDLTSGDITADALADTRIMQLLPASDGQSLYVLGPSDPAALMGNGDDIIYVLRRLDAETLETLAEREFDGHRMVMLWPPPSPE